MDKISLFLFLLAFFFCNPIAAQLSKCSYQPFTYTSLNFPGVTPQPFPQTCADSANDISSRLAFTEYNDCLPMDPWGPQPNNYPLITIPDGCDSTLWMQTRVLRVIDYVAGLKFKLN